MPKGGSQVFEYQSAPKVSRFVPCFAASAIVTLLVAGIMLVVFDPWSRRSIEQDQSETPEITVVRPESDQTAVAADHREFPKIQKGSEYRWSDGDRALSVHLATNLVAMSSAEVSEDDLLVAADALQAVVVRRPGHSQDALPVFVSASDNLMTLPGGVILVFHAEWGRHRIDAFLVRNGISADTATEQTFAENSYFVETEPGFPSLNLANRLAEQSGIAIASPNWWKRTWPE